VVLGRPTQPSVLRRDVTDLVIREAPANVLVVGAASPVPATA
jgi:hypothetical protein